MTMAVEEYAMGGPRVGFKWTLAVRWGTAATSVLGLALLLALPCGGQSVSSGGQSTMPTPTADMDENLAGDLRDPLFAERRLRQLSIARHKSMVDDTGKLLKLVTELNAEISSTKPSELTPEQLRKVAEIEKLARGVKDKMRISLTTTPIFVDSTPTPPFSRR
jgi:hypothetical protein